MKNTFTIKVRTIGQDDEPKVIKGVTAIFSNLGGFLVSYEEKCVDGQVHTFSTQLDDDSEIIIDGSDDSRFNHQD